MFGELTKNYNLLDAVQIWKLAINKADKIPSSLKRSREDVVCLAAIKGIAKVIQSVKNKRTSDARGITNVLIGAIAKSIDPFDFGFAAKFLNLDVRTLRRRVATINTER